MPLTLFIERSSGRRNGPGPSGCPFAIKIIQDPATGSGGFLVSADNFIRNQVSLAEYKKQPPRYQGVEIEKNTRRICLMNTFLHGLNAEIYYGDALTDDASFLEPADLILANPPFGTKAGSKRPLREDIPYPHSNKQLAFLQHIYLNLKDGGRAAVVLPDNVLSDEGVGRDIRADLMRTCNLHTILRLPSGIFSSAAVKTNVLFFTKAENIDDATKCVWVYDMRANMPNFGKTSPLTTEHFKDFEECYGSDPYGQSPRKEHDSTGRFRCFTREEISADNENLFIKWLREDETGLNEGLTDPHAIALEILQHLRSAISEIEIAAEELSEQNKIAF